MKRMFALVLPLTVVLLCSGTMGCWATVGYVIGDGIDDINGTRDTLWLPESSDWKSGQETIVITKDGRVYTGEFQGMGEGPLAEYQLKYGEWHAHNSTCSFSPELGDTLMVGLRSPPGSKKTCLLVGFRETSILCKDVGDARVNDEIDSIQFKDIATIRGRQSAEVSGGTLLELVRTGQVPSTKCLIVSSEDNASQIPWHSVSYVRQTDIRTGATGKIVGAGIGLVCDAVITAVIINRIRQPVEDLLKVFACVIAY